MTITDGETVTVQGLKVTMSCNAMYYTPYLIDGEQGGLPKHEQTATNKRAKLK